MSPVNHADIAEYVRRVLARDADPVQRARHHRELVMAFSIAEFHLDLAVADPLPIVRREAAELLGEFRDLLPVVRGHCLPDSVGCLRQLTGDPDAAVRRQACLSGLRQASWRSDARCARFFLTCALDDECPVVRDLVQELRNASDAVLRALACRVGFELSVRRPNRRWATAFVESALADAAAEVRRVADDLCSCPDQHISFEALGCLLRLRAWRQHPQVISLLRGRLRPYWLHRDFVRLLIDLLADPDTPLELKLDARDSYPHDHDLLTEEDIRDGWR